MPGIGKTEVGLEAARQLQNTFDAIVLHQATSRTTLGELIRQAGLRLGLAKDLPTDAHDLASAFANRGRLLFVIDNAEDLMREEEQHDELRSFLDTILDFSPETKLLLTTRWPVDSPAEFEVKVPPLNRRDAEALLCHLLKSRTKQMTAWSGTAEWNELLDIVDGHPRSIDLIAGHIRRRRVLAPIVQRLKAQKADAIVDAKLMGQKDAYERLDGRERARLLSLRASMDISFEALAERHPEATELMGGLALFPGGLPTQVAKRLPNGDGMALDFLVDWSFVDADGPRLTFPVPIRWYAEKSFRGDPTPYLRAATEELARWCEANHELMTSGQIVEGVQRTLIESSNLRYLSQRSETRASPASGVSVFSRLATTARQALIFAGELQLSRELLEAAEMDARLAGDKEQVANILQALGDLHIRRDALVEAGAAYQQALDLFTAIDAKLGQANTLQALGDLHRRNQALVEAGAAYQQALDLFTAIDAKLGQANTLQALGDLHIRRDALVEAGAAYQQALDLFTAIDAKLGQANTLKALGDLHIRRDALVEAGAAYQQALDLFTAIDAKLGQANTLKALGDLHIRRDALVEAGAAYQQALDLFTAIDDRLGQANTLQGLGLLELEAGRFNDAFERFSSLMSVYTEMTERLGVQAAVGYLARTAAMAGETNQAIALAERSLEVGREVNDRFGQKINLELQFQCFLQAGIDVEAIVGTAFVLRKVAIGIDEATIDRLGKLLDQLEKELPAKEWTHFATNPEHARRAGVQRAEADLADRGRGLFDLPG